MNVLLIDIDSLRADRLGCYGYPRPTSPHIDALAERGWRLDRCSVSDAPCQPLLRGPAAGRDDLAAVHPGALADGLARLESWTAAQRARNPEGEDPMDTVLAEGGPSLARGHEDRYEARLRATGRAHRVERMRAHARAWES